MFAQSAEFIKAHQNNHSVEISCYGQERVGETWQLCMMNPAVHALSGDIRLGNSDYEDPHESLGKFDFVMANPLFNVDKVDKETIKAGAAQQNVSQDVIREIVIARLPVDLVRQFNDIVSPTLAYMFTLQKATANLRTTRDLLLPKLISGKQNVEDLDIDAGMTAEEATT
jgi:hypothetical protein